MSAKKSEHVHVHITYEMAMWLHDIRQSSQQPNGRQNTIGQTIEAILQDVMADDRREHEERAA